MQNYKIIKTKGVEVFFEEEKAGVCFVKLRNTTPNSIAQALFSVILSSPICIVVRQNIALDTIDKTGACASLHLFCIQIPKCKENGQKQQY